MTCQVGPVIGSDTAPARQPSKSPPIERGGPGNGVNLRANSSLAGVDSASGFFSGGRGLGLSEPGSIGSIKCFSCATAELAAARKRTASRQTTARISNYTSYGSVASPSVWGSSRWGEQKKSNNCTGISALKGAILISPSFDQLLCKACGISEENFMTSGHLYQAKKSKSLRHAWMPSPISALW